MIPFFKKEKKEPTNIFQQGYIELKDKISPNYIDITNPRYLNLEEKYYSGLFVVDYAREQTSLLLEKLIDTDMNMNLSIFYEKQDRYKIIRDLTYHIGNTGVDLKDNSQNRQDIDIAAFTYNDAKYIRKEMQINNEEMYFLYLYCIIFSKERKQIELLLNKIENLIQSSGMQVRRAYFRQEQLFLSCLPFLINHADIKQASKRNVLTSGLMATYPFLSSSLYDETGVFYGINHYNHSLVFIDRYNMEKYKNANMCVFGTSGAGKSFFIKLIIFRYFLIGIQQYVIDPEREYNILCKNLGGTVLKIGPGSDTYINIFDIRKESLEEQDKGYLATKIIKLIGFFKLIFGEMDEEEKALLEEKIIQVYKQKGISFEDDSLYKKESKTKKRIFKDTKDMPKLDELYSLLGKDLRTKKFYIKLIPFIKGSLKFFNEYTNVALNKKLIVADVYELGEENLKYGMYIFTDLFWDKIKKNRNEKKAIYLDEIWRLIGVTSNKEVASFIYKIFKTIRKYGGSGIAITQDVYDLFSLKEGVYGESILNNSSLKAFFSLEEQNIKLLEDKIHLSEQEKIEIKMLKRGECLLFVEREHVFLTIESSKEEKQLIVGEERDESNHSSTNPKNI